MARSNGAVSGEDGLTAVLWRGGVVAVVSFLLGGLTSFAQGFLPYALTSFANSPSGWTALTALLVFWSRLRAGHAAVAAAVSFVLLVLGYTAASQLRGLFYDPLLWSVIGVVVGPFVGAATAWLRGRDIPAALGVALLSGVGIGDAVYGLTVVRATTSPVYWTLVGVAGLALLVGMLARRIRGVAATAVALGGTAVATGVVLIGYRALMGA